MKLTSSTLRGNWGTLLLPVNVEEEIDYDLLEKEIDFLIDCKISGIYSFGSAGELHNVTEYEFQKVNEILAKKCHEAKMPFQIGVSHPFPKVTVERLKTLSALQPAAFQFILPDWVALSFEEVQAFVGQVCEAASGIPVVLYNPPHAKLVLAPSEYELLADQFPPFIGIKVAGGDADWYAQMRVVSQKLSVFLPGHHMASGVQKGVGCGAYSNVACINPRAAQNWWALIHSDIDKALDLERRINSFFEACIVPYKEAGFSNPALDKMLAAVGGWLPLGTRLRKPYKYIPEEDVASAAEVAKRLLPEFYI